MPQRKSAPESAHEGGHSLRSQRCDLSEGAGNGIRSANREPSRRHLGVNPHCVASALAEMRDRYITTPNEVLIAASGPPAVDRDLH